MRQEQEPITPTMCDRCGNHFNTSEVHPRQYCSIACEEGRTPLPESDPASNNFHLYVQGNPEALVGNWLVARGLKRTCYAPKWHKNPADYSPRTIVSHDKSEEVLFYKTDVVIGKVYGYHDGVYDVEYENMETGEFSERKLDASLVVDQLRRDDWWVDG